MRAPLVALALLGALLLPSTAAAQATPLTVWVQDRGLGAGQIKVFRDAPEFTPVRVQVVRDGETIADATGSDSFLDRETDFLLDPLPGDLVRVYEPATAAEPTFTHLYDGRPALGACPAGARTLDARLPPGTGGFAQARSLEPFDIADAAVAPGPLGTTTLAFPRALRASDTVELAARRLGDGVDLEVLTARPAGACSGPVVPPAPTIADGRVFPTLASTLVTRQDVRRGHSVVIGMGCDRASRVPCRGVVRLQTVPTRPGQLAVEVGRERAEIPAGVRSAVSIVLADRTQALLRAGREARIRMRVDFRDTVGRLVTRTQSYRVVAGPA